MTIRKLDYLRAGALFLSVLLVCGPIFAQTTPSSQGEAESERAFEEAYQEVLKDPGNLDKSFRFAQLAIERGDFEAAVSALERMLIINPKLSRVRLELGVLYYRLGSYAIAKSYLESAVRGDQVPPLVRDRVAVFLAEIDDRLSRSRAFGSVTAGLRYQTNANSGPPSSSVLLGGFPADLDDAFTQQSDGNFFGALNLRHIYDFETQDRTTLDTDLFIFGSKQFEEEQVDVIFAELLVGPRFRVSPEWSANALVRPFVRGTAVYLDDNVLYGSFGGGVELSKQVNDRLGLTARYDVENRRFNDTAIRPTASNENGVEHKGQVTAAISITPALSAFARSRIKDRGARVGFEESREYSGLAGVSVSYDPPVGNPARRWVTAVNGEFSYMKDGAPDPAVDPATRRTDKRWDVRIQTNIPLTRLLSLGISATHARVNSNIPNFDLKNTTVAVSASHSF